MDLTASGTQASRDTTSTYDENNNLLTTTDANSHTTILTYDALGRKKTTTLPNGLKSEYFYDANSNLIETKVTSGDKILQTTAIYDKDNRKISSTDASSNTTRYEYNKLGQVTNVIDPTNTPTIYTYDYRGKVKTETRGDKTIFKSYDEM